MVSESERLELENRILKYRSLAKRVFQAETARRIYSLIVELEQKLREGKEQVGRNLAPAERTPLSRAHRQAYSGGAKEV